MSTGEGKAKVLDEKETTVYKRALDQEYKLKLKASRQIFSEINKRYPTMPFTVRSLDSKQGRLGLVECLNHGLLHPYPVLHEKVCSAPAAPKGAACMLVARFAVKDMPAGQVYEAERATCVSEPCIGWYSTYILELSHVSLEHQRVNIAAHAQAGERVAQFKATVLLMPNGSDRVTSAPLQKLETDKKVCSGNF